MKKALFTLLLFTFTLVGMADVMIAEKGKSNHVIMIPDSCSGHIQKSVYDMQNILHQITGVKLPVKKESTVAAGVPKISVGNTTFAKQHLPGG